MLDYNEFDELIPGEEIEGLSNKEVEKIIEEHTNIQEKQTKHVLQAGCLRFRGRRHEV